jgi:hypothetical protein
MLVTLLQENLDIFSMDNLDIFSMEDIRYVWDPQGGDWTQVGN